MATQEQHSALHWLAGIVGIGGPTGLFAALWGLNSSRAKHEEKLNAVERSLSDIKSHLLVQDEKRDKLTETVHEIKLSLARMESRVIKP